jgi:predicted DNA-binding transcriptional regulator YafY
MSPTDPSAASNAHTRRERVLRLLESRNQAQPLWTAEELAAKVYCSVRTLERDLSWLREHGHLPRRHI